jgi:hypothetical protein
MNRGLHVKAVLAVVVLSSCLLCLKCKAKGRASQEPVSRIPYCDAFQRCINSCAELVRSFGTEEITQEQAKARMEKLNGELQTIFVRELRPLHETEQKFSPEEEATLVRSLEDIINWTLAQTIMRTRTTSAPPLTPPQLEEMKAAGNSLKAACPNIIIPQIQ